MILARSFGIAVFVSLALPLVLSSACGPAPKKAPPAPIPVRVVRDVLTADGLDHTRVIATIAAPETGDDRQALVVSFTSTGGLLSSSAAPIERDGTATVTLFADREDAMLGRAEKPVTVRATVKRGKQDVETGTATLTFVVPTAGAPHLRLSAEPPVALANGTDAVTLTLSARRLTPGTVVNVSTTGGSLSAPTVIVEGDEESATGTVELVAPTEPQDVVVTATEPGGAFDTLLVRFVADGAAQFDLTGTFAQSSPARIRMTSSTLDPSPQCVTAPAFIKVTITQVDDRVHAEYETCFVTLAPVKSIAGEVTNSAPPAFMSAIPLVIADMTIADVVLGATFDPPESVVVSGAALSDPDSEELPTDENDDRVRDSDNDDRPGVTVINSLAGEQNITFRNRGDTAGRVESSNRIVGDTPGSLTALPESSVLGFGNSLLPDFEALPSVFEMVRVDGRNESPNMDTNGDGQVTCQEIVDARELLFTLEAAPTPLDCAGVE